MTKKLKQVMIGVPAYDGKVVCDFSVGLAEIFPQWAYTGEITTKINKHIFYTGIN